MTVIRDGTEHHLNVELAEVAEASRLADDRRTATGDTTFGVSVAPLTPDRRTGAGLPSHIHGLVVEAVTPDSRAAAAGLQPGDVIEEVNRQPVSGVEQLRAALNGGNGRPTLLLVNRDGKDLFLTARAS